MSFDDEKYKSYGLTRCIWCGHCESSNGYNSSYRVTIDRDISTCNDCNRPVCLQCCAITTEKPVCPICEYRRDFEKHQEVYMQMYVELNQS